MKLYRNAVVLIIILGLLTGAYFVIKNKKGGSSASKDNRDEIIKIIDTDRDKVAELTITNKNGRFVFTKKDKDFVLSFPEDIKADKDSIGSIISNVTFITADRVIEENAADLSRYGFDNPVEIALKLTDGTTKTVELGNMTSTKDAYYVIEKGGRKVYTMGSYTVEKLNIGRNDLKTKVLFTFKTEDVTGISMEKGGNLVFSAKKAENADWALTAPIEGNADYSSIGPMIEAVVNSSVINFIDENPADLGKYGLASPAYSLEIATSSSRSKILLGSEKEKGSEIYAKLEGSNEVFTMNESPFNFLDKPLKEIVEVFAYIVNINDVNKIIVEMDGKTVTSDIRTVKDDSDKDKFFVDGRDATVKDENDNQLFRKYYQGLIGVTLSDIEIGANPTGKPDIIFTYYLKKAPGVVKMEFIPKEDKYYYVVKNGKYSNIIVAKKKFDEPEGVRETYKKLVEAMDKADNKK